MAHLRHPVTQQGDVFGRQVGVVTEAHFQLVDRLRGQARQECLPEAVGGVVKALEPIDAGLHSEAGAGCLLEIRHPGERGQAVQRLVTIQIIPGFRVHGF